MSLPPPRKVGITSIVLVGILSISMVLCAIRRDRVLKPGLTIQFDDFFFTLRDVTRAERLDDESPSPPVMVQYIVTLTIENRAVRVPFRFSDASLAIIDQKSGNRFYVNRQAQTMRRRANRDDLTDPLVLKAGASATREYVFLVPANVVRPRLRIAPGGWLGLAIDRLLTGTKEFDLP